MPDTEVNPAQGEPADSERPAVEKLNFRQRAELRLKSERNDAEPAQGRPTEDDRPERDDTDELSAEPTDETSSGPTDDIDAEADAGEGDESPEPGSVEHYRQQAEKAEQARRSMERDYRIKTHKIGAMRRELSDQIEQSKAQTQLLLSAATREVQKYAGVNWELERARDPGAFQQKYRAYESSVRAQQQLAAVVDSISKNAAKSREAMAARESELSMEVIKTFIPDWGEEKYKALRSLADKEALYTPDEFDSLTDWRPFYLLHQLQQARSAPKTLGEVSERRMLKHKPAAQNASMKARSADGKFMAAKDAAFSAPGNRLTFRQMKIEQLRRERTGRR